MRKTRTEKIWEQRTEHTKHHHQKIITKQYKKRGKR